MRNVARMFRSHSGASQSIFLPSGLGLLQPKKVRFQCFGLTRSWCACSRAIVPCGCCDLCRLAQDLHDPAVKNNPLHIRLLMQLIPNHTWHGCGLKKVSKFARWPIRWCVTVAHPKTPLEPTEGRAEVDPNPWWIEVTYAYVCYVTKNASTCTIILDE